MVSSTFIGRESPNHYFSGKRRICRDARRINVVHLIRTVGCLCKPWSQAAFGYFSAASTFSGIQLGCGASLSKVSEKVVAVVREKQILVFSLEDLSNDGAENTCNLHLITDFSSDETEILVLEGGHNYANISWQGSQKPHQQPNLV